MLRDHSTFANSKFLDEQGRLQGGVIVPANDIGSIVPNEVDPPEWRAYRTLLNPFFSPAAVDRRREQITDAD